MSVSKCHLFAVAAIAVGGRIGRRVPELGLILGFYAHPPGYPLWDELAEGSG
jgi:hypothetical protein